MSEKQEITVNMENFVKAVLDRLNIPTKSDINELHQRLDSLEQLLNKQFNKQLPDKKQNMQVKEKKSKPLTKKVIRRKKSGLRHGTSISKVFNEISMHPDGITFKNVTQNTGIEENRLRNIISRLNKLGKIKNIARGIYVIN